AKEITVTFFDGDKKMAAGKTVTIDTNSANIAVNKTSETTDLLGQITFKVSASREGVYYVYLTVDGVEFRLAVGSTNTSAAYIATEDQPAAPIAQYEKLDADVTFTVTDINGNIVRNADTTDSHQGMNGIYKDSSNTKVTDYLFFVEKPAASKLKDKDLKLKYNADDQVYELSTTSTLDAEGTYTVKAILDNGAFATATFEVKRFGTPVTLYIECARNVELGKHMIPELKYVDANGVTKAANDATMSATGYAIYSLMDSVAYNNALDGQIKGVMGNETDISKLSKDDKEKIEKLKDAKIAANKYAVNIKTDEKYVGTTVTYVATSERYNLVGTAEVKIGSAATDIAFEDKALAVNANNDVVWNVVDADGNKVKLDSTSARVINYVVLDKPEGAKVSVYDKTKANFNGEGKMAVTSNKVGNVTIQAVCQVRVSTDGNDTLGATQTKYYTGTKIFAVGTEGVGKVVVMSIGSNEIIVNDAKATIDAAPIVENNRTFVPFRALAEAFGATVAYDEATQAVTAELNGTTVVMTIGSATYTVNGVEKTADVAPFINGSRTMVPVRFAAEAFGIKVIPTYDENGATADILFNL
ncbi:MAG: copper amine oxidase N-terminal domain-containing protein, partial [Peptococcaceae bacterium]|nr:copper amine oxidase N-terminal domain-containing protein [Peptococcaceae bacterium]